MPNNFTSATVALRLTAWPNSPENSIGTSADSKEKNKSVNAEEAHRKIEKELRIHHRKPITLTLVADDFDSERSLRSQFSLGHDMRHVRTLRAELVGSDLRASHHVELANVLLQCVDLRKLHLAIPFSGRELEESFIAIESLKNLKHLTLDVPDAGGELEKENIFISLGKSMRHLSELEHLNINMLKHGCSNNELNNLLFYITKAEKLKSFSLDITEGSTLSSEAARDALRTIGSLKNLEKLYLKIDANTNINKRNLLSTLESFNNLREFEIHVDPPWTNKETIKSIEELKIIIETLK
jgi:hypothetical protein